MGTILALLFLIAAICVLGWVLNSFRANIPNPIWIFLVALLCLVALWLLYRVLLGGGLAL